MTQELTEEQKLLIANRALTEENLELKMEIARLKKPLPLPEVWHKAYHMVQMLESGKSYPQSKVG